MQRCKDRPVLRGLKDLRGARVRRDLLATMRQCKDHRVPQGLRDLPVARVLKDRRARMRLCKAHPDPRVHRDIKVPRETRDPKAFPDQRASRDHQGRVGFKVIPVLRACPDPKDPRVSKATSDQPDQ